MNFNPHDYQDYAIRYIEKHPVAAVLLDMGLGKTIISLTAVYDLLFDSFEVHRVLVVAPFKSRPRYMASRNPEMGAPKKVLPMRSQSGHRRSEKPPSCSKRISRSSTVRTCSGSLTSPALPLTSIWW